MRRTLLPLCALFFALGCAAQSKSEQPISRIYIGTYTDKKSEGIYAVDMRAGDFSAPYLAAKTKNPSFVAIHPSGRFLYAVNEVPDFEGKSTGAVSAFRIREDGRLELLNQVASGGADPCYISIDKSGRFALIANYTGGSVTVIRIESDGKLGAMTSRVQHNGRGADPERQEAPHAHFITLFANERFAIVSDLGLDQVIAYPFNRKTGVLDESGRQIFQLPPRSGPRHFTFSPDGKHGYIVNELSSTVTVVNFNSKTGKFSAIQSISTLPAGYNGRNDTAEIRVHPSGKFLYASNRGHDSIAVFAIDPDPGKLTLVQHSPTLGQEPRNFVLDPSRKRMLVGNQNSGWISIFEVDERTGRLTDSGKKITVDSPVCLRFAPTGKR
jgi:6-phosphogluconolactonase